MINSKPNQSALGPPSSLSNPSGPHPPPTSSPSSKTPTAPCPRRSVTRRVVVDSCRRNHRRKIPRQRRQGISHRHHSRRGLCRPRGRLLFAGWLLCRRLRLSSPGLHLHPALDFLRLPAGHPPIERGAGFGIADAPLSATFTLARRRHILQSRVARIRVHAAIVVFDVERNISVSASLVFALRTYMSKILTDIFFFVTDIPHSTCTMMSNKLIKWCQRDHLLEGILKRLRLRAAGLNSLTAIVGHDRPYFYKLCARVVSLRIFVRSQRLMARKIAELFSLNRGVRPFYAARCFDELSRGSFSCFLNASFKTAVSQCHNSIF